MDGAPYWGKGLIPEVVQELMRYSFEDLNSRDFGSDTLKATRNHFTLKRNVASSITISILISLGL